MGFKAEEISLQKAVDLGGDDGLHDIVAGCNGMYTVLGVDVGQSALLIDQSRVVIHIRYAILLGIVAEQRIESTDDLGGVLHLFTPRILRCGQHRADDGADVMKLRQFAHRLHIVNDMLDGDVAVVECDIVGAGQDDHDLRLQSDDIRLKTHEHLGGYLSADAAVGVVVVGEEQGVRIVPLVGDGIADEDYGGRLFYGLIGGGISVVLRPVVGGSR